MEFEKDITTGLRVEKKTIHWKIEDFELVQKSEEFIGFQKITFCAGDTIGLESKWWCYLRSINERMIEFNVKLEAIREGIVLPNEVLASVNANITMKNGDGILQPLVKDGIPSGIKNFMAKDWSFTYVLEHLPLVNGCLLMDIQLTLYSSKVDVSKPTRIAGGGGIQIPQEFRQKFIEKLQEDMRKLMTAPTPAFNAEAKVITKDGKEFPVQRGLLSVRSPMFETMFQSQMMENNTGIIRVDDLSSKTMSVLLEFLYTGMLHQDWSNDDVIVELVYAAGKYQLQDLLGFFDKALGAICNKVNAGKLINLANKLELAQAEGEIFNFMKTYLTNMTEMVSFCNDSTTANSM